MAPLKGDTMKDLTSLQEKMNRIFGETVKRIKEFTEPEDDKAWAPPVDIFELPDSFILLAEVPGISKEEISVEVQGNSLIVRGERLPVEEVAEATLYRSERYYGFFERSFNMPVNVDPDRIKARVEDGVLTITVAKPLEDVNRIKVEIDD